MQGETIGEVRGVADNQQNLEGDMAKIAEEKMKELPGAERYLQASADMKHLTVIEKKIKKGQELTKDDLVFLYEINSPIEGFGYQKDPRIQEFLDQRNPKEDAPILLECQPKEIAWNQNQINKDTKAYIGPLFKDIFKLEQLEHIYTSFPEGKIRRMEATIGGTSKDELEKELKRKTIYISDHAQDLLQSKEFTVSKTKEHLNLIRLTVKDLGFPNGATTEEIYTKAKELGLELCPAETGPQLRLQYTDQPLNERFYVGMKQILDRQSVPRVFFLFHIDDGLLFLAKPVHPPGGWHPDFKFVFFLRK